MKIYYQWEPGSYSHLASKKIQENLSIQASGIVWCEDFDSVWEYVSLWNIGVLPIENSYAGSIHTNVYNFLSYTHKIIWEYNFEVEHCLLSLEDDISEVSEAFSHHQALSQTQKYLRNKNISAKAYFDTAGAAKMIADTWKKWVAAVASELAWELYQLNILEKNIQDQSGNTTKFLIIVPESEKQIHFWLQKWRVTFLLKTDHTPWSLYTCLWVFAQAGINMKKIESIPLWAGHFSYAFWITVEGTMKDSVLQKSLQELDQLTDFVRIIGEY